MTYPKQDPSYTGMMLNDLPVIETPFTRLCEHWMTSQGTPCQDYELDLVRCQGAVGLKRAQTECSKFMDDWMECRFKIKAHKRYQAMRDERDKQGKEYKPPPPMDSIHTPIGHD